MTPPPADVIQGPRSPSRVSAAEHELRLGDAEAIRKILDVLQRNLPGAAAGEMQIIRTEWRESRLRAERILVGEEPIPE